MVEHKRRVQDLVEESRFWDVNDLIRNLEDEMQRLEQGLGQVIFDVEGRPVTICLSPLPFTPKFEESHEGGVFSLKVHLPDVDKDDIRLFVTRDAVDLRAISERRMCRPFLLSVKTPWNVDPEEAEAEFENGVLTVKAKRLRTTRVQVR